MWAQVYAYAVFQVSTLFHRNMTPTYCEGSAKDAADSHNTCTV
jgi:hypothetical protein